MTSYCSLWQECTLETEAFGFEQSKKCYSLHSFGEKANQFKSYYFRMRPTVSWAEFEVSALMEGGGGGGIL